jgi:hypothetical protein
MFDMAKVPYEIVGSGAFRFVPEADVRKAVRVSSSSLSTGVE